MSTLFEWSCVGMGGTEASKLNQKQVLACEAKAMIACMSASVPLMLSSARVRVFISHTFGPA